MSNSVFAVLHEPGNPLDVVLVKTEYNKKLNSLPGGKIEKGELPIAALKREVKEETGLKNITFVRLGEFTPRKSEGIIFLYEGVFYDELKSHVVKSSDGVEISGQSLIDVRPYNWDWFLHNTYKGQIALLAFYLLFNQHPGRRKGFDLIRDYLSPPYMLDPFETLNLQSPYEDSQSKIINIKPDCESINGKEDSSVINES